MGRGFGAYDLFGAEKVDLEVPFSVSQSEVFHSIWLAQQKLLKERAYVVNLSLIPWTNV